MKDAQCVETNDKAIFQFMRFLFFELWSILFTIFKCISDQKYRFSFKSDQIYMKDAQCTETNEKSILRFLEFLVFEILSILY